MAAFVLDGRIQVYWFDTIPAAPLAPTQTEITAADSIRGTKQTEELIEINGFEKTPSTIPLAGYAGREVGALAGEVTYAQSSLAFRKDSTVTTTYTLLVDDEEGWLGFAQDGAGSGKEMEIFPAQVAATNRRKARNVANSFEVFFSISAPYKATQAA